MTFRQQVIEAGEQGSADWGNAIGGSEAAWISLAAARAALEHVCNALERPSLEGWNGEDADGDYMAAQTIREKFLAQLTPAGEEPTDGNRDREKARALVRQWQQEDIASATEPLCLLSEYKAMRERAEAAEARYQALRAAVEGYIVNTFNERARLSAALRETEPSQG